MWFHALSVGPTAERCSRQPPLKKPKLRMPLLIAK